MATRRPKVPSAQFTTGAGPAGKQPAAGTSAEEASAAVESSTPEHHRSAHRTPVSSGDSARRRTGTSGHGHAGHGHAGHTDAGRGGAPRDPQATGLGRSHHEGVIHDAGNTPVPARSFNGRLLVLGLAMGVVTLLLAPNVHTFMEQRAEISALKQDIAAKTAQQAGFESELARWDDPEYVKQQARDRVSMLMPGETGYWVYGANGAVASGGADSTASVAGTSANDITTVTTKPWVDGLWDSIQKSAEVNVTAPATKAKVAPAPTVPAPTAPATAPGK